MTTRHPPVCLLRKSIDVPTQQGTEKLSRGELVVIVGNNGENKTISLYLNSTQNFSCSEKVLKNIPLELVDYLLPVVPSSKRIDAYSKLDRNLMSADLGVLLSIERGRSSGGCIGELRYKGEVKNRPGIWFGIKLVGGQSPIGDSDGSVEGSYYMDRCSPNTVIFATIDELSIIKSESSNDAALSLLSNMGDMKDRSLSKSSKTLPLMSRKSTNDHHQKGGYTSPCSFSVGEEVVVLKNKLPATPGVVRAVFQDQKRKWLLGVELDTPTGDSDGAYRGQQLFNCLPKHAVFCEATEAVPRHYYQEPRHTPPPPYNSTKMDFDEAFRQQKGAPPAASSVVDRAGSSSLAGSMVNMSIQQEKRVATPEPPADPDPSLEIGSMVQVSSKGVVHYGVIRWIGSLPSRRYTCAGLELEDDLSPPGNDGIYDGVRYFTCPPFRALFCYLHDCSRDRRFEEVAALPSREEVRQNFGPIESGRIEGKVDPPKTISANYIGRMRGIQGNRNSCYLDATLYAMFAFDSTMDYMLSSPLDSELRKDIQVRLREEVVNPLREGGFVGAEHMRQLRDLLGRAGSLEGLQDEEKEPEELLSMLFTEIFCIKPLLSFRDGNSNEISHVNLCQILLDRDPNSNTTMPNTQDLLTRYFVTNNLYFHSQPDLLLLQVPRSGKDFKLYDTVLPSTELQLGGLCGGVWGGCYICDRKPTFKCSQCYLNQDFKSIYSAVPFCTNCCKIVHSHPDRQEHTPEHATNPTIRGLKMVLSAVLCIHTSHYVTYCRVPAPSNPSPPPPPQLIDVEPSSSNSTDPDTNSTTDPGYCWVFFDSMADRNGGQSGYNIPIVEECPQLEEWLGNPSRLLHERDQTPDFVKRLISDALLCFYVRDESN